MTETQNNLEITKPERKSKAELLDLPEHPFTVKDIELKFNMKPVIVRNRLKELLKLNHIRKVGELPRTGRGRPTFQFEKVK